MAMVITPESELGKELAKWNKPYRYEAFPKMLYLARRRPDGCVSVAEVDDGVFGGRPGAAEAFTGTCQRTVHSEDEMRRAMEEGWRNSPNDALKRFESKERAIADVAAHRAYEDRNMGELARAEAAAADAATSDHLPEIPEAPVRRSRKTA